MVARGFTADAARANAPGANGRFFAPAITFLTIAGKSQHASD
jgi:hypothetical protein